MTVVKIKKQKVQKSVIKRKIKFKNYKNCLNATQLDHKITYLEKMKLSQIILKKIIKKSISKST